MRSAILAVPLTEGAPNTTAARVIQYDDARFGALAEPRRRDREVGARPR